MIKKTHKVRAETEAEGVKRVEVITSIRLTEHIVSELDKIAEKTKRSRSQVARLLLENGLSNYTAGYFEL